MCVVIRGAERGEVEGRAAVDAGTVDDEGCATASAGPVEDGGWCEEVAKQLQYRVGGSGLTDR